jgi:acetyl esterase
MDLDPKAKALLTAIIAAGDPGVWTMDAVRAREMVHAGYEKLKQPLEQVHNISDTIIPGPGGDLSLRVYTPVGNGPFPVLLFIHGGGWVLFRPKHYDAICTHLSAGASCMVVSVDYRLSPETHYPGALEDCMEALSWLTKNSQGLQADASRIIVCGDSAGGTLAAALALKNRDLKGPGLLAQALIYPAVAWYEPPTPSFKKFAGGYSLTADALYWLWDAYLGSKTKPSDPYAVPMEAVNLKDLPEALVLVSGYDPLRDEGIAYAGKLDAAGVKTTVIQYGDMIHGFLSYLGILDQAETAIEKISSWLIRRFNP